MPDKFIIKILNTMKFLCFSICGSNIPQNETPDYFDDIQPFVPPINEGHVIKVYDGDTITIVSKLPYSGSPKYKFSVRLAGIDSAEMSSKNANEKAKAIEARDALSSKIMGKQVTLTNVKTEKYGRILADVHLDGAHLNEWMIKNGFAVPYDCVKKNRPDDWN